MLLMWLNGAEGGWGGAGGGNWCTSQSYSRGERRLSKRVVCGVGRFSSWLFLDGEARRARI